MENGGRSTAPSSVIVRSLRASNSRLPTMNFPPPTPEQARVIWLAVTALAGAVLVGILAGVIWGFGQVLHLLSPVLWPLAVAGSLAQKEQRDARDMTASSGKESGTEGGPHRAGDRATAWRALRERKERARKESGPADGSRSRFYAGRKAAVKVVNRVRVPASN